MWDSIPFKIQVNILKRLPVKSLLPFRSVSKACKSLIDSSAFIADYQHTERQQHILVRRYDFEHNYVSVADDDTFPHQNISLTVPMSVKLLNNPKIIGCSQGLFCFYDYFAKSSDSGKKTAVIWNPTIRKSVSIDVPNVIDEMRYLDVPNVIDKMRYTPFVIFGVCPHTLDPMLVNISIAYSSAKNNIFTDTATWRAEIFRLSSGAWKSLSINLPRMRVVIIEGYAQVIDRFIYWLVLDKISRSKLIISFDMISEVFTEIRLPDNLALNSYCSSLYLHNFNGSLVVVDEDAKEYAVWMMMENGDPESFIKLYTIKNNRTIASVSGFRKSGELLVENSIKKDYELSVYDPKSGRHIGYTRIYANETLFFESVYTETLLLLDHKDCISTSL